MNGTIRTVVLFGTLILLFMAIGYLLGAYFMGDWVLGSLLFLGFAGIMNFISYFFSGKIVLWSYRAKLVSEAEAPRLYAIVKRICLKADLPMPKVAIVPAENPNAFATGRNKNNAVVAVTRGLLTLLSEDEIEGVLSHEMAHVKNKDILVMSAAATIAGAISFASRMFFWSSLGGGRGRSGQGNLILFLVVVITAPIAAMLVQLAISRNREYKADREGALMIQRPLALARALEKLEEGNRRRPIQSGNPATSSLFIVNPFRGGGMMTLFMTHPPIAVRIRRLEELAQQTGYIG